MGTVDKPTITRFRRHSADGARDLILAFLASWRFFVSSGRYEVASLSPVKVLNHPDVAAEGEFGEG